MNVGLTLHSFSWAIAQKVLEEANELGAVVVRRSNGITVVDCNAGNQELGLLLIKICGGGRLIPKIVNLKVGNSDQLLPHVEVKTMPGSTPTKSLLCSQFAGRQFSFKEGEKDRFWMGSGPFRCWTDEAELWQALGIEVETTASPAIVVLEGSKIPSDEALEALLAKGPNLVAQDSIVFVASTDSVAGHVQIVGRILEVGLHCFMEHGGDPWKIKALQGFAPLPPQEPSSDMIAMGRTNDAGIYGGAVRFTYDGQWDEVEAIAQRCCSLTSPAHGKLFTDFMQEVGWDFTKVPKGTFAPAVSEWELVSDGGMIKGTYGEIRADLIRKSFAS